MSSSKTVKSHRDLYKTRTPPWKETYRKRCMDRLRDSRERLKAKFRNLATVTDQSTFIEDLMIEELKSLRAEQGPQLDIENDTSLENVDIDRVLSLFEDIQSELRQEEMRMLKEFEIFEQSVYLEEKTLCSAIDKLSTDEVICPLCKKNPLLSNKSVIFCKCGIRINTEQDCLTLSNVKTLLDKCLTEHVQCCESEPNFSLISEAGHTNLLMTCQSCDWMSIII